MPSGEAVILKAGVPHDELFIQMEEFRLYGERGAARLLDADCELGAILMEHLELGIVL